VNYTSVIRLPTLPYNDIYYSTIHTKYYKITFKKCSSGNETVVPLWYLVAGVAEMGHVWQHPYYALCCSVVVLIFNGMGRCKAQGLGFASAQGQGGSKLDPPRFSVQRLPWGSFVFQWGSNPHNPPANFYPALNHITFIMTIQITRNMFCGTRVFHRVCPTAILCWQLLSFSCDDRRINSVLSVLCSSSAITQYTSLLEEFGTVMNTATLLMQK